MNRTMAELIIGQLSYKTGWNIAIDFDPAGAHEYLGDCYRIAVWFFDESIVNGRPTLRDTAVQDSESLQMVHLEHLEPAQLIEQVWRIIRRLELHESKEWFRFDGLPVHNPHPEWIGQKVAVLP